MTHNDMTRGDTRTAARAPFDAIAVLARRDPVTLRIGESCGAAARRLVAAPEPAGQIGCVVDAGGRLAGLVTLAACVRADPAAPIDDVMIDAPIHATTDWTAEQAARTVVDQSLAGLPVLDGSGRPTGLVTTVDAYRYLLDELEEDADIFVGLVGQEDGDYMGRSIWADFGRRVPWILGLAVAGLAAGYVVHVYEDALDALVILALYMPMVADTGGNVGTQSASLVTRAISFGDVRLRDAARILWREARVALLLAATLFLFAYLKVLLISNAGDVPAGLTLNGIGLAIAVALAAQVFSATLIGAVLPVAAVAARQDPAVVSGPALTTIVDLTGLILYFSITTHLLGLGAG